MRWADDAYKPAMIRDDRKQKGPIPGHAFIFAPLFPLCDAAHRLKPQTCSPSPFLSLERLLMQDVNGDSGAMMFWLYCTAVESFI